VTWKARNANEEGKSKVIPQLQRSGKRVVRASVHGCVEGEAGAPQLPGTGSILSSTRRGKVLPKAAWEQGGAS